MSGTQALTNHLDETRRDGLIEIDFGLYFNTGLTIQYMELALPRKTDSWHLPKETTPDTETGARGNQGCRLRDG